jgi:hypothetical protein
VQSPDTPIPGPKPSEAVGAFPCRLFVFLAPINLSMGLVSREGRHDGIRTRPIVVLAIYSDRFGAARSMEHV